MFIVQCYIFIGYRAAESNKEKKIIICDYYQIWLLNFFWLKSLIPNSINENCELYFHI